MQKLTSKLPSWDTTKTGSKKAFDKTWAWADKLGAPINKLSNKIGSEAFWPMTLDKESDKAARILRSFCKDGFYAEEDRPATEGVPKGKQRVLKKIPEKVIQNAVGLAIFTTMRTGLWVSGAGGSGVLIARMENGEWSPPSGILLHTAGLGFLVGVDIYDCVVVINNRKALESFTSVRATIGGEISAVAGPVGIGGVLENDGKWKQANRPVFTYLKSRGFYAGVQVDGTVIIERGDENERFFGQRISVKDILAGKARHPPYEVKMLMETVKAAEGRSDVDRSMMDILADQPAPGDVELEAPQAAAPLFGIPEPEDPDPYGVLALEAAGLEIREAGTKSRPPSTQFEYNPSPTSPVYSKFHRRSMDTLTTRSNRESYMSTLSSRARNSIDRSTQTEMGTQTDDRFTPNTSPSRSDERKRIVEEDEHDRKPLVIEPEEIDYTKIDLTSLSRLNHSDDFDGTTVNNDSPRDRTSGERRTVSHDTHDTSLGNSQDTSYMTEDDDEEEPVIFEAASAQAQVITPAAIKARGGLVDIPKRPPPPPLPPRSVARASMVDQASGRSPAKEAFEEIDLHGADRTSYEAPRKTSDASERSEANKGIVMEDLEKEYNDLKRNSFDTKAEHEREVETLDSSLMEERALALESDVWKENTVPKKDDGDETDDFHSVPTTPMEVEKVDSKPMGTVV